MNAQEAAEAVKNKFGKVVQAVAMRDEMTFLAVAQFSDEGDDLSMSLWPNDMKDFYVPVKDIANQDSDRWIVRSERQDWVLQKPPVEAIAKNFAEQMRGAGFDA